MAEITAPTAEAPQSDLDIINEGTDDQATEDGLESDPSEESDDDDASDEGGDSEEETDDEDAGAEDDEDSDDANDELTTRLKAADKDIFKKFPGLQQALQRDAQYANMFSSPEEAEQAVEMLKGYQKFGNDISNGEMTGLFKILHKDDKLDALAENFLPQLHAVNSDLYERVLSVPFKNIFLAMFKEGKNGGDTQDARNLYNAALIAHRWIFGNLNIDEPAPGKRPVVAKDNRLEQERQANFERLKSDFNDDVVEIIKGRMTKMIEGKVGELGLNDPYLKKNFTRDVREKVDALLREDKRHIAEMNNLWRKAGGDNFTRDWKMRIANTYINKVNAVLPEVIRKAKIEAKINKPGKDTAKKLDISAAASGPTAKGDKRFDPKKIVPGKNVDFDILSDNWKNIKYRS